MYNSCISCGIGIQGSVDISCFRHSWVIVLLRNSIREGPVSGSFGGGKGSGRYGIMLNHLVGSSSTGRDIWFFSKYSHRFGAMYYVEITVKDFHEHGS
jgi:hypothetical protein